MLRLYVLAALILSAELQADEETTSEEFTPNEIDAILEERCLKNANGGAYDDLWGAIFNFHSCMVENMQNLQGSESADNVICTKTREGSYKCLKHLLEKAEPCLHSEEKFLLEFVLNVHNTSFEQECNEGVVSMHIRKSALESAKCDPPVKNMQNKLVETCFPKVELVKKLRKSDYVLKKVDLCSDLEIAKECAVNEAELRCRNEESVVEFVTEYFDQYLYWCRDDPSGNLGG